MKNAESDCDHCDTFRARAQGQLCSAVDESVQDTLLEESPERQQNKTPTPGGKMRVAREPTENNDQDHRKHRGNQKQAASGKKGVSAQSNIAQAFTALPVRIHH